MAVDAREVGGDELQGLIPSGLPVNPADGGIVVDLRAANSEQSQLVLVAPRDEFFTLVFRKQARTLSAYATTFAYVNQSENQ